ncbi:hypothetical protein EDC01DRAFT_418174 [Geopyxis carbonaria]|nr:hypothetical protein EDC01DRAFT_418174 [Geopyxis carbonaria]
MLESSRQRSGSVSSVTSEIDPLSAADSGRGRRRKGSLPGPDGAHTRPTPPHTTSSPSITNGTGQAAHAPSPSSTPPPTSRRPSWLLNISSKFSSNGGTDLTSGTASPTHPPSPSPESPKHNAPPGFLMSTLRRLSATGTNARDALSRSKTMPTVGRCERVILNKDQNRERCIIPELDGNKLRKVAFCVDVEVAPSSEDVEARKEARRKRREAKEKEKERMKQLEPESTPGEDDVHGEKATSMEESSELKAESKGEKSEEKPKEKEDSLKPDASREENSTPATDESPSNSPAILPKNGEADEKPAKTRRRVHPRPTTDPIKIYTQCCQLRETQMLPEIKEQLVKANGAAVLQRIDMTGHALLLPDVVAFSDFLALVPVKELILENCDLTDEMVRVVLSALSTVKVPAQFETTEGRESPNGTPGTPGFPAKRNPKQHFQRGVVERLSLKDNPRLGRDGWRYVSCFVHMSHSLRALDMSKIILPRPPLPPHFYSHNQMGRTSSPRPSSSSDTTGIFARALGERLIGSGLDEVVMGNCSLSSDQLKHVMEGITKGGTRRVSLEGNSITDDGIAMIGRWMKGDIDSAGVCEVLDLSNNDIQEHIGILSASIDERSPLIALNLSNCNLTPESLASLLPALTQARSFRWLDLSNNPLLFSSQPDSLPLLRRFLPKMLLLRKIDLSNTSMNPDHAIALSEILPEIPMLSYFKFSENPLIPSGKTKMDEGSLEEGAALYTALNVAVKISKNIVRVDMDEPGPAAGEVIRNLSRRLLAHCLKNMESCSPEMEDYSGTIPSMHRDSSELTLSRQTSLETTEAAGDEEDVPVANYEYDDDGVWRDEENYVVGGTGVVKALGVCLGNKPHNCRPNGHGLASLQRTDTMSSIGTLGEDDVGSEKAGEMSKALLTRARMIKERIQPALQKAYTGEIEEFHHRRLLFLDETLFRVIHRFEEEYPECKQPLPTISEPPIPPASPPQEPVSTFSHSIIPNDGDDLDDCASPSSSSTTEISKPLSRRASEVSLHSRYLEKEEGQMHKLANYMKKEIFLTSGNENEVAIEDDVELCCADATSHDKTREAIMDAVENLEGEELRRHVLDCEGGVDNYIERMKDERKHHRQRSSRTVGQEPDV